MTEVKKTTPLPARAPVVDPSRERVPDEVRGLNNPDPHTGESAAEIERQRREAGEEDFEHPELVVQARRAEGFNRGGYRFPGDSKTIIPANTLSEQRYNAIVNEPQLVVLEKPKAEHKKEAVEAVPAHLSPEAQSSQAAYALGGSKENATPEMLDKAKRGEAMGHPSMGNPPKNLGFNRALDPDFEEEASKQRDERTEKAQKESAKAEKKATPKK